MPPPRIELGFLVYKTNVLPLYYRGNKPNAGLEPATSGLEVLRSIRLN